ncbi:MAG: redox-regulated ATPase YchF [Gemmatimonadaceae bacterium]|nr:redox-regulated ATPase YchF [Gemmatimonadaceae bacterium]
MRIGLVGFAGSGKTTVFNTLTGLNVPIGFGGEVHLGTVKVPDVRIDTLSAMFKPKKTTYAEIVFSDIPGEHGAEQKGLSGKALQQIRDQDVLALVLRDFENPSLDGAPNPMRDLDAFATECLFADLAMIERWLDKARKERKDALEISHFEMMRETLEAEKPLRSIPPNHLDRSKLTNFGFLTDRPLMVVLNRGEAEASSPMPPEMTTRLEQLHAAGVVLSASVEAEIAAMDPADQKAFLEDLGLTESAASRFIRGTYALLDLISFFTVGQDEVRAWPILRGTHAKQAAGKIHSDLERGFIRAEVMSYDHFLADGSEHKAREVGHLKLEGKDYVVQDGDILHIRFNV